jgi:hypothetical protein
MITISPQEFMAEFVEPSLTHYGLHQLEKHLAVNAIAHMDTLAEVVAIHLHAPEIGGLKQGKAGVFRKELRRRLPVLGTVSDAHDCHKHGKLGRQSASEDPKGMASGRPEAVTEYGFFCDITECDGDLTPYETLAITLNDGTRREVMDLLCEALQAWRGELQRLGI